MKINNILQHFIKHS